MTVALYMNQHVPRAITTGLRLHGADVLTAQEDNASRFSDSELLNRATELGRVLFTQDDDLLAEAVKRQRNGITFAGVIYAHQLRVAIGTCIRELDLIAKALEPEDLKNLIQFLPL